MIPVRTSNQNCGSPEKTYETIESVWTTLAEGIQHKKIADVCEPQT